tara:strand:+ start:86 stop:685 length:600 start_codon:yes stop_codon:yes gene_type:complete
LIEQVYDFRCRIVSFHTQEFDVGKVLQSIYYDADWERDIENRTMMGGYQIRNAHLTEICDQEMRKFMGELTKVIQQYLQSEYVPSTPNAIELPPIAIDLCAYWINVMPPGAYHRIHTHPNTNLSGVIYLQAPEGSGDLYIPSPYDNCINTIIKTVPDYVLKPEVRQVYLFPSSLPHSVSRNESDEDRVSISFNIKLKNL